MGNEVPPPWAWNNQRQQAPQGRLPGQFDPQYQGSQQPPVYSPQQQAPPWMQPRGPVVPPVVPPKGNPTKKKKVMWYVLVSLAVLMAVLFVATAVTYYVRY
jgi:hypothetical protein